MKKFLTEKYKKIFEERNFSESVIYFLNHAINKVIPFEALRICTLTADKARETNMKSDFTFQAMQADDARNYQYDDYYMPETFLKEAATRGDTLYGCVNPGTDRIVSYGWYTRIACKINDNVMLNFSDRYFYMYNGYTEPAYRGYRLHGIGMAQFAAKTDEYGKLGLVSYIKAENYRSIRSCVRLGYQFVGYALSFKLFGKYFFLTTPGCAPYKISLEEIRIPQETASAISHAA